MIEYDVVDAKNALRHDPQKLAQLLLHLFDGRRRTPSRPGGQRVPGFSRADLVMTELEPAEALVAGSA
jgi:hypothetical protein